MLFFDEVNGFEMEAQRCNWHSRVQKSSTGA